MIEGIEVVRNKTVCYIGIKKISGKKKDYAKLAWVEFYFTDRDRILTGDITGHMACSRGYSVDIGKHYVFVHEKIEDSGSEDALHSTAFKNKSGLVHRVLLFRYRILPLRTSRVREGISLLFRYRCNMPS